MDRVFTTGEAAKICRVSQQTIIRCFDNGSLNGFRVPGSKFRRIPEQMLCKFMRENHIPTDLLSSRHKVLIVDHEAGVTETLLTVLSGDARVETRTACTGFDAGMLAREWLPEVVVLDVMLPDADGAQVCRRLRGSDALKDVRIICTGESADRGDELRLAGSDDYVLRPFVPDAIKALVFERLALEPLPAA